MRDKREIGFDILDNADLEQIEEFAMDSNMLDDETKNRIKNIIDKKCKEAKGEIIMNNKNFIRNIFLNMQRKPIVSSRFLSFQRKTSVNVTA